MGKSGRNGDVSTPTTLKHRDDLHGLGSRPAGRATAGATPAATDSAQQAQPLSQPGSWLLPSGPARGPRFSRQCSSVMYGLEALRF